MNEEMYCPKCGKLLFEEQHNYTCAACGFKVWKEMSGHKITSADLDQLREKGETEEISFVSKSGNKFKTRLVMLETKIEYAFNLQKEKEPSETKEKPEQTNMPNTAKIRVESVCPGRVHVHISGINKDIKMDINYGIESSRKSECLGLITAAYYVRWLLKDTEKISLQFSVNNLEFANYLLKEMTPRDKEMQKTVEYLWNYLKNFRSWSATYQHTKKQKLEGSNFSDKFPRGIFPWLHTDIIEGDSYISIILPLNPAVYTQFKACFTNAALREISEEKNSIIYTLPKGAIKAVSTWISVVKNI